MLEEIKTIARRAGSRIMEIYKGELGITFKSDDSPLTLADKASHELICSSLQQLYPQTPIISEEGELPTYAVRRQMTRYFLVDPLDGTKEFIKRNGEFTVNIALIEEDRPVLGVVYIPAMNQLYAAAKGQGSQLTVADGPARIISASKSCPVSMLSASMSRSHPSEALDAFLKRLEGVTQVPLGSALKFCRVAEGVVDFYPRLGPLMEWDTAAAHVVAEEAGAIVTDLQGKPLAYNKEIVKHQGLICAANQELSRYLLEHVQACG